MSQKVEIQYRTITAATLNTATYVSIGNPITVPGKMVIITSTVNANILISWDGINDHLFLENGATPLSESLRELNFGSLGLVAPSGRVFAKLVTATAAGSVFVTYMG